MIGFFVCLIIHACIHRILLKKKIISLAVLAIYMIPMIVFAFAVLGYIQLPRILLEDSMHVPLTAFVLYFLLVCVTSIFYLGVVLGGETPSSMMIAAFTKEPRLTPEKLARLFTEKGLLWKRIDDLVNTGMIYKQKGKYRIKPQAMYIARCIVWYQQLFARCKSG
jgi:hypothetical protein